MPSVASACMAAKFCARPVAAITPASSPAEEILSIFVQIFAISWLLVTPPTIPTDNGNSNVPVRFQSLSFFHSVNDLYLPLLDANA